jgi:hypothetical protein
LTSKNGIPPKPTTLILFLISGAMKYAEAAWWFGRGADHFHAGHAGILSF